MPWSRFWVVSHWLKSPREHIQHVPQLMLNGTTTRSPTCRVDTADPTSRTTPIGSCPTTSPGVMNGVSGS